MNNTDFPRNPRHCKNRTRNKFRCAGIETGKPHTPKNDGSDCAKCPAFDPVPDPDIKKLKNLRRDNRRGAFLASIILIAFFALLGAGIYFAVKLLIPYVNLSVHDVLQIKLLGGLCGK